MKSPHKRFELPWNESSGHFGRFFLAKEKTLAIYRFTPRE
jgi:hypothetical protein